jgi:hypothetical protein
VSRTASAPAAEVPDVRIAEYWHWFAICLYLHVTLDTLMTMYAAASGHGMEANPIVRWALAQGIPTLVGVNLAAGVATVPLFAGLVRSIRTTPASYRWAYQLVVETWLGGLITVGFGVFANNLTIVIMGRSLVAAVV